MQALDAVINVFGKDRVGVGLTPYGTFNDMTEPRATAGGRDDANINAQSANKLFRKKFKGAFISAGSYNPEDVKKAIKSNEVDVVSFARIVIILSIVICIKKLLLILF